MGTIIYWDSDISTVVYTDYDRKFCELYQALVIFCYFYTSVRTQRRSG